MLVRLGQLGATTQPVRALGSSTLVDGVRGEILTEQTQLRKDHRTGWGFPDTPPSQGRIHLWILGPTHLWPSTTQNEVPISPRAPRALGWTLGFS